MCQTSLQQQSLSPLFTSTYLMLPEGRCACCCTLSTVAFSTPATWKREELVPLAVLCMACTYNIRLIQAVTLSQTVVYTVNNVGAQIRRLAAQLVRVADDRAAAVAEQDRR